VHVLVLTVKWLPVLL